MSTRIELRAMVAREGQLLFFRDPHAGHWELPGGAFPDIQDDVDAAMDSLLRGCGIVSPNVAEDFLQTSYLPGDIVLNLYAPISWQGKPAHPEAWEDAWFAPKDLSNVAMDDAVRSVIVSVFGTAEDDEGFAFGGNVLPGTLHEHPPGHYHAHPLETQDRRVAGLGILRTLAGVDEPSAAATALEARMPEIAGDIIDFGLGEVWSHPALDRKQRSLQVVAMLAALGGRAGPLRSHVNGALNHGATPEQIVQTLRMVAVYAGFPVALEAWPVMEEVFAARGIERPGRPR